MAPKKKGGPRAPAAKLSAAQLYEQAQIALQFDDYEGARDALRRATQMEPENVEVVEAYGSLLAEIGDVEEAVAVLRRAVQLAPDQGHAKYMYLGQVLDGEGAVEATSKGVELLQKRVEEAAAAAEQGGGPSGDGDQDLDGCSDGGSSEGGLSELQEQLCSALCSLAEQKLAAASAPEEVSGAWVATAAWAQGDKVWVGTVVLGV
jgi:kinesin family protein 5